MKYKHVAKRLVQTFTIVPVVPLPTGAIYQSHGKALTAGRLDLALVMLIAFRWGLVEAAVASVLAVACLDYFYMTPIFSLYERNPQDWFSSGDICGYHFDCRSRADRIERKATQTETERTTLERFYVTSRHIIRLDHIISI
jgi:two-component system sensor histidine kinase KdpD